MKKKYIFSLVLIGIMLTFTLTVSIGYGLWIATRDDNSTNKSVTLNCFKVFYSDSDTIEMKNINPVVNEEGMESSPYTLTITNICDETKELQVRLNVLDSSTIDSKGLTIEAAGNIKQETILYENLSNSKTSIEKAIQSKLIGLAKVEPNETVRTNIKIWFDEKKSPEISKDAYFKVQFELIDTESSIKPIFAESLLNNVKAIENKINPSFDIPSHTKEGLYLMKTNSGNNYYYRGVVDNNYVSFANLMWRIIRVNSDNSIRLILDKSATYLNYNDYVDYPDYVAFSYLYYNVLTNNKVQNYLGIWYNNMIVAQGLDSYVTMSNFCNDTGSTVNSNHIYFNGYNRLINAKTPSLDCPVTTAEYGGIYNQKVGLITADEVVLAGGLYSTENTDYYLYNGENFYTMTGADFYQSVANVFYVNDKGMLNIAKPTEYFGIRPVINLNANTTVSGTGTVNNPYIVDLAN